MSYYCKGEKCNLREGCLRANAWKKFPHKEISVGVATGLWLVDEDKCKADNFRDGVFAFEEFEVLDLILKGKYYDMIEHAIKREEYREITPYWTRRLKIHTPYKYIRFHRGYTNTELLFKLDSIVEGRGDTALGAPADRDVYILKFH